MHARETRRARVFHWLFYPSQSVETMGGTVDKITHQKSKQRDEPIKFVAITCNSLKAREKSYVQGAIGFGFGFGSHWLKRWREIFLAITNHQSPITNRNKRNSVLTFDSHLTVVQTLVSCVQRINHYQWN